MELHSVPVATLPESTCKWPELASIPGSTGVYDRNQLFRLIVKMMKESS
ncbi:hypothetical protein HanXRQr2_Chr12g0559171 [Helianthus annuus]|uniref:Uncharacterized protein n=1 Tax=Helianthus annuus TaxID=4232 RepID=A0A9K3HJ98_HELAN|nr:hypothetical protein HanXRQr2_Chr12g0559171 [Helianthus annuus]KAJ0864146.1 hypothetical protein HanPSC8_Chr12g0538361 [Helianthus annuus]